MAESGTIQPDRMEQIDRILVIDDDEASIYLTKRILKGMGVGNSVQTAKSGLEGLKLLKEARENRELPQLILLDVNMYGMGGFAFLEELAKFKYVNMIDTKIVLLSGSQNPADIGLAEKHLAAAYLNKPLTKEKLLSILD